MLKAFFLSISQLSDRRILAILGKVAAITLGIFALFGIAAYFALQFSITYIKGLETGAIAALGAIALVALAAVLLFRVVAIFVLNIFSDDVVYAVEKRYYPEMAERAKPPSYILGLKMGIASAGRAAGYNLLATPIYIALLITGVGTAAAFFVVNGILIGRDLQNMVASRHIGNPASLPPEWTLPKIQRFLLGLGAAVLLAIPFVNFLAPVVAAAMATHLVHHKRKEHLTT